MHGRRARGGGRRGVRTRGRRRRDRGGGPHPRAGRNEPRPRPVGQRRADTGDFQVGIRLAYLLDRPVVAGVSTVEVDGDRLVARGGSPDGGTEIYEVPLPAVATVMEGGVEPRYPSIPGRMKAKKVTIEELAPTGTPTGPGRIRLKLPPAQPSQVEILGEGPEAAPAVVDLLEKLGVLR